MWLIDCPNVASKAFYTYHLCPYKPEDFRLFLVFYLEGDVDMSSVSRGQREVVDPMAPRDASNVYGGVNSVRNLHRHQAIALTISTTVWNLSIVGGTRREDDWRLGY